VKGFYSPIDQLAAQLPRTKGTGAEFMTELSKRPGYKPQEAQDRELQTLMALPKMERAQFLAQLKAKPAPKLEETTLAKSILKNPGLNVLPDEPTKYEDYSLPGGSNYREILLRMPHDEQRAKEFSDPSSGHWDQPNVLAHVRAKDRTGPNGEKILHLEEIQSDWHQQGRDRGYATPEGLQQFKAAQFAHRRLKEQLEEEKSNSNYLDRLLTYSLKPLHQDPEVRQRMEAAKVEHNNRIMDLMPQVMKAQAEAQDLGHKLNNVVPNAPFKKNWHELALKKMIHHAAANGYDSIAITPGQEQAKRYSLSRQVGRITHMTHSDTPDKGILFAFDPKGNQIVENHNIFHKDLPRYIGKEGAQKLLEQKPDEHGYRELSGQNLEVGGEGMKGFYDKMVPAFLNQFGKKYGAQVGKIQVPVKHELQGLRTMGGYKDEPPLDLHHFPITPEMREDVVKNGVPLYADGGSVEDKEPKKTVKAYKMFRVDKKQPGKLFPLFVDSQTPVKMDKWITAKEGEKSTTNAKKVKSKIGDLAYRPGWHAGDLPIATHIGDKDEEQKAEARRIRELRDAHAAVLGDTKAAKAIARKEHPYPSWVNAPRLRNPNHIWAEVEMPNDVDWQSEATKRGTNDQGKLIASQAHITDQLPLGGHYRYKTNSNMLGNWLIGGSMKVNRILHDKEVEAINKAAGAADLPRAKAMNQKAFGFAEGGTVGPEEWMAEEHVNHKVKGGVAHMAGGSIEYQGEHKPPSESYGAPLHDLTQVYPEDIYSNKALQYYGMGHPEHKKMDMESLFKAQMYRDKPNASVSIFRAVPEHVNEINPKDWVTLSPAYAKLHGESRLGGKYKTLKKMVKAKELWTAGDTIHEWGYHPEEKKAKGGSIKPVGYTKEKVTVSPNLDQMRYELMSVKHYVKKAK